MGNKYIRVYDIRTDTHLSPLQYSTKAVNGITVDPFNPYRFISNTDDNVIKVWDIRKNNEAISFFIIHSYNYQFKNKKPICLP
jgi:WD40 repeat protein